MVSNVVDKNCVTHYTKSPIYVINTTFWEIQENRKEKL